jgi:3-hydroxyacyl-CoA dehydrogenase
MSESGPGLVQTLPFRRVAVLGAGVMGGQIAAHFANAGLLVDLLDVAPDSGPKNAVVAGAFKKLAKMKPPPFFDEAASRRIRLGNFDEHLARLGEADWIVEAVVERMEVKRPLLERVEQHAGPGAVVSTNTSGLPIHQLAEGRSSGFRARFLGTHFFNPPRYLDLFEIIPTSETDPAILQRVADFARLHLGKGVVVAKDTPNFIGNRIGVFALMLALHELDSGRYSVEEIDILTGPLVGRPKSATFRTADVVGLDTLVHVARNLHEAVPDDESREVFTIPRSLEQLVDNGALGAKTGAGFYRKDGKTIVSIDPRRGEYTPPSEPDLGDLQAMRKAGGLADRLRALFEDAGRAGEFFRRSTLATLAYSARRLPEIADSPADVDRALRWGFGWEAGPFETWDLLGFERVRAAMEVEGLELPGWIGELAAHSEASFYRGAVTAREVFHPGKDWLPDTPPADEFDVALLQSAPGELLWSNEEAALHDMGDGVALYEFRSKANTLGRAVMKGLDEAIGLVERSELRGLVIGNDGANFSVGANLAEVAALVQQGAHDEIEALIRRFQAAVQRVRYAAKPVVVAASGKTLGGGCELVLACPHPVAAAETYLGLVELGVGLIPAGTGTTRMAHWASRRAADDQPPALLGFLERAFRTIAMADVAMGARAAQERGLLAEHAVVVMRAARRLHVAKQEVLRLAAQGCLPPPPAVDVMVAGRPGGARLAAMAHNLMRGRFASEYDRYLAERLAWVLTGGDLTAPQRVPEDYLLELERKVFIELLGQPKTHERIEAILTTNKPLRN